MSGNAPSSSTSDPDDLDAIIEDLWKVSKSTKGKQVEGRNMMEKVIEWAFGRKRAGKQRWRRYMDMALPGDPCIADPDSITVMELPESWKQHLQELDNSYALSWSFNNVPESIVTFVFIENNEDPEVAKRLLTMCLYAAQMHRRAICCKDNEVMGVTYCKNVLSFFVTFWKEESFIVQPLMKPFDVSSLVEFFQAHTLLCKIAEREAEYLKKEFERWDNEMESHLRNLRRSAEKPWRKVRPDNIKSLRL